MDIVEAEYPIKDVLILVNILNPFIRYVYFLWSKNAFPNDYKIISEVVAINNIIAGPIVFLRGFLGLRGNCSLVLLVAGVMNDTLF